MSVLKKIIPAIIATNQKELDSRLGKVRKFVDTVQLDIMDNEFVPNTSLFFDFDIGDTDLSFEAHLMVKKPELWMKHHIEKVDTVLVQYESDYDVDNIFSMIEDYDKRVGFVLNPETPLQNIDDLLDSIDQVLIMTVNPGFYGSPFLPEMTRKISELRSIKPDIDIEVDGGITDKTIQKVDNAGANLFVSGSFIVKSDQVKQSIQSLRDLVS